MTSRSKTPARRTSAPSSNNTATRLIEPALAGLPGRFGQIGSHAVAVGLAFALITTFHIVLGELAPKSLALQRPEGTATVIVCPLRLFLVIFRPAIYVLNGLGNAVLRLCGLEPGYAEDRLHSTGELKLLVQASREGGRGPGPAWVCACPSRSVPRRR